MGNPKLYNQSDILKVSFNGKNIHTQVSCRGKNPRLPQAPLQRSLVTCFSFKKNISLSISKCLRAVRTILFGSFFLLLMAHPSGMHDQLQTKSCGIRTLSSLCVMCFIFRVWMILFSSSSGHC